MKAAAMEAFEQQRQQRWECAVCLETLKNGAFTALLCGHRFHTECLAMNMDTNHVQKLQLSCPFCRANGVELKESGAELMKTTQTAQNGDQEDTTVWATAEMKKAAEIKIEDAANRVMCKCGTNFTTKDMFAVLKNTALARNSKLSVGSIVIKVAELILEMNLILEIGGHPAQRGRRNRYFKKRSLSEIEATPQLEENKKKLKLSAKLNSCPRARQIEPALRACCVESVV